MSDTIRNIGGVTVDGVRYGVQTKGWQYGDVAVIQHIELTCGGKVLASEPNTEAGRQLLREAVENCGFPDSTWLIALINSVNEVQS